MNSPIPVYSSDMFDWKNGNASAEASDFGPLREIGPFIGRPINGNKRNIGFYVLSARTGVKMLFTYVFDEDGYDGELQVYSSGDHTITIVND